MSSDSSAVFFARVTELGLTDLIPKFKENGWESFNDFAFSCSDFSGKDPALFEKDVLTPLGVAKAQIPKIRRLFMQAYVVGTADLEKLANPQAEVKVAMHPEDRMVRTTALSQRITGFNIKDGSDPSHKLIDLAAAIIQRVL